MKRFILLLLCIICGIYANAQEYNQNYSTVKPVVFDSYIQTGVIFNGDGAGPIGEISMGGRFFEHLYLGGFIGIHSHFVGLSKEAQELLGKKVLNTCYLPIGANIKIYLTKQSVNINVPYIESSLGGFVGVDESKGWKGFFCQVGLGMDFGMFAIGIGYNGLVNNGTTSNLGYVKLGIKFPNM